MSNNHSEINIERTDSDDMEEVEALNHSEQNNSSQRLNPSPKWINNKGEEVKQVFGFNENAELVNARVAIIGFLMLVLTELAFAGEPATLKIFGIN